MHKKIENMDQLESFTIALINAVGEISKDEAINAVRKGFQEFRESFSEEVKKQFKFFNGEE